MEESMGMRSVRSSISAFILGCGLSLTACDKPSGSTAPGGDPVAAAPAGESGASTPSGGGDPAAVAAGEGGAEASAPAAPPCDSELDIQPTSFFGNRILMTLPKGVEMEEQNPFFARSTSAGQVDSCGRSVPFAAVGYVRSTASLADIRRRILALRGFETVTYSGEQSQGDTTVAIYDADPGGAAVRGLVLFKRDRGWYYWSVYEASPEDFPQVEQIYRQSFASLMIRPVREG